MQTPARSRIVNLLLGEAHFSNSYQMEGTPSTIIVTSILECSGYLHRVRVDVITYERHSGCLGCDMIALVLFRETMCT